VEGSCREGLHMLIIALSALLAAGYLAINLVAPLPAFLIGENIVLASSYGAAALILYRGDCRVLPWLLFLSAFNAGRVSRSIITPTGELGVLAVEHVPLLTGILLVSALTLVAVLRLLSSRS